MNHATNEKEVGTAAEVASRAAAGRPEWSPGDVLTLAEAAAYLKLSEADVLRLVHDQALPARRLANEWRFLKAAIQQWLSIPPPRYSKEAQMAVIGAWKDDPYAEEMLERIWRERGQPVPKD